MTLDLGEWKTTPDCQNWPSSTQANQSALAYVTADVFSIVEDQIHRLREEPNSEHNNEAVKNSNPVALTCRRTGGSGGFFMEF